MDLAPSAAEQVALYATMFAYAATSLVLYLMGVVLNWAIAREVGTSVERLLPKQLGDIEISKTVTEWLERWHDEFRRVRRSITFMFATAFLVNAFAMSTLITVSGTFVRDDGRASQWQRWVAYSLAMALTTAGMAQYYALETIVTWLFALLPATAGMGMGVFVSLSSVNTSGGIAKAVNFSIWGPVLLVALIPLFYIYTNYSLLGRRWWRGLPIVIHVVWAMAIWIVLWASPEVGGPNNAGSRTASAWAYGILVWVWYLSMLVIVYFWKMGPPKRRTSATDAVVRGSKDGKVVNLDPRSPNFQLPPQKQQQPGRGGGNPESVRGQFTRGRPAAATYQHPHKAPSPQAFDSRRGGPRSALGPRGGGGNNGTRATRGP